MSADAPFSHLHLHTQYSVLQASSNINALAEKAIEMQMPSVAITDNHNMFGAFKFINAIFGQEGNSNGEILKPIIGCEVYVAKGMPSKGRPYQE